MVAFYEQHGWGRYWLMTCVIAGMLVASPLLVSAQDGTPEPETLVVEDVVPTPTPIPPTPIPPTATSVPPTATTAPTATDVPPTATAVPPTPTSIPPTSTSVPPTAADALQSIQRKPADTATPTSTPAPSPTPTPTPVPAGTPQGMLTALRSDGPSIQVAEGTHECTQVTGSDVVAYPDVVEFNCEFVAGFSDTVITRTVAVPPATAGWRYWIDNPNGPSETGETSDQFTGYMAAYTVYFGPTRTWTSDVGQLTITITYSDSTSTNVASLEARTPDAPVPCAPAVTITKLLDFGSTAWNGSAYIPVTSSLALTISESGLPDCSGFTDGWTIQLSATAMDGPGEATISADAISYLGTVNGGLPPVGLTQSRGPIALATTNAGTSVIATGSSAVQTGAVWNAAFTLQPPNTTLPGDYNGTITITVGKGS